MRGHCSFTVVDYVRHVWHLHLTFQNIAISTKISYYATRSIFFCIGSRYTSLSTVNMSQQGGERGDLPLRKDPESQGHPRGAKKREAGRVGFTVGVSDACNTLPQAASIGKAKEPAVIPYRHRPRHPHVAMSQCESYSVGSCMVALACFCYTGR